MKKLFFAVAAIAALLVSCSTDETIVGISKSKVTFTINSPELATRADDGIFGNGAKATKLYYAVYDAVEGGLVRGLSKITKDQAETITVGVPKSVTLNLVEGRTYDIIFYAEYDFAAAEEDGVKSPYIINWENQTFEIATPTKLDANMEEYDAFYAHVDDLTIGKTQINRDVDLKRPFAQLNILTNDRAKGEAAGIDITNTSVTVTKVYTKMNLLTDQVDPASESVVTYAMNKVPMTEVVVNGTKYHWLSMNYLLVNGNKTVGIEFMMQDAEVADGQDDKLVRNYSSIAVQRNHRTNIYGSIITNPAKFNVEIKPGFEQGDGGDHNHNADSN